MKRTGTIATLLLLLGFLAGIQSAVAADRLEITPEQLEKIRQENAKCLECHSADGLEQLTRKDVDKKELQDLLVDVPVYNESNHGRVECVACHLKGFKEFPHAEPDKKLINNCDECHTRAFLRIEDQFAKSVHAKKAEEKPGSFVCTTCHNPHIFRHEAQFAKTRQAVAQDNGMCLQCHGSDQRFVQVSDDKRPDLGKAHDWLPNIPLHWDAVRCVECHTPVPKKILSHEILDAEKAEKNCVACHSVDSTLRARLYRHKVVEERNRAGIVNSVILNEAYVIGATRNQYLDWAFGILTVAVVAVLGLHGLVRIIAGIRRRRRHG